MSDLQKIARVKDSISLDDYNKLKSFKDTLDFRRARVGKDKLDVNYRDAYTAGIPQNKEFQWLYDKVFSIACYLNSEWNFILKNQMDLQWTIYNKGGFYGTHTDNGTRYKDRKISVTILLSNPVDFKRGQLKIFDLSKDLWNKFMKEPLIQFEAIFFPSSMIHSLPMVTEGKREVLIGFIK